MKTLFIILTASTILSQVPHSYVAIEWNSHLTNKWVRIAQSIAFCAIISVAILAFALEGLYFYALGGAILEVVINVYYYGNSQKERQWSDKLKKNWFQFFLAVLIPMLIFVFSHQLTKY